MTRVVVVGAGIAGLASALALARRGLGITVVERRPVLDEAGAGLQLSPNAVRCLERLGLGDAVRRFALESEEIRLLRGRDGKRLATISLGRDARERYGAPFLLIHRADLHRVLRDACEAATSVEISLGSMVRTAGRDPTSPAAIEIEPTAGGPVVRHLVDGVVEADGVHAGSLRGKRVSGGLRASGHVAWRALIPASAIQDGFKAPASNLWLGPRAHLVHYPLRDFTLINVVAVVETDGHRSRALDQWAEPGDPAVLGKVFDGWHPTLRTLVAAAPSWRVWPLPATSSVGPWSVGTRTRVGDAAHPMLPFLAQGASQAIEDATVLGAAVAAFPSDLARGFAVYEAARRPRTERVQEASRKQGRIYHLGGPGARARDLALGLMGQARLAARMDWLYGHDAGLLPNDARAASLD